MLVTIVTIIRINNSAQLCCLVEQTISVKSTLSVSDFILVNQIFIWLKWVCLFYDYYLKFNVYDFLCVKCKYMPFVMNVRFKPVKAD